MKANISGFDDNKGFVLITSIMIIAILTIAGIAIVQMTSTEVTISKNTQLITMEFYDAESGIVNAFENPGQWMTDEYLVQPVSTANTEFDAEIDSKAVALVQIRNVESSGLNAFSDADDPANEVPEKNHIGPTPEGSGYSATQFEVRHYGFTATSEKGNSKVQVGAWKVFNKF